MRAGSRHNSGATVQVKYKETARGGLAVNVIDVLANQR
jgi:hypothetical protein